MIIKNALVIVILGLRSCVRDHVERSMEWMHMSGPSSGGLFSSIEFQPTYLIFIHYTFVKHHDTIIWFELIQSFLHFLIYSYSDFRVWSCYRAPYKQATINPPLSMRLHPPRTLGIENIWSPSQNFFTLASSIYHTIKSEIQIYLCSLGYAYKTGLL